MELIYNPEFLLYINTTDQDLATIQEENAYSEPIPKWVETYSISNLKPDLGSEILVPSQDQEKKLNLLSSLSLSGFNPSPVGERLTGDLFYIHARSL